MTLLDSLKRDLPLDYQVDGIYIGDKWILSVLKQADGQLVAGVASSPREIHDYHPKKTVTEIIAQITGKNPVGVAIALATINALLPEENLSHHDAADWLSAQSRAKNIAIFGRFPFIDNEIRPFAKNTFVFEREPLEDEFSADDIPTILPQADIIAITGSTIINHTIDNILVYTQSEQQVILLGPSTPLTSRLFAYGIDAMFGVRVADIAVARASVTEGRGFQKMQGLERVSLLK